MHGCPDGDCLGHEDLGGVIVHGFQLIATMQAAILRELRQQHRGNIPHHVQAGLNALSEQIWEADQALSHQSAHAHHNPGRNP